MKYSINQVVNEVINTVDGTCTYSTVLDGLKGALFNLLASDVGKDWFKVRDELTLQSEQLAAEYIDLGIESALDKYCDETCFGACGICGWMSECCYTNPDSDEGVCDECQDEDED